MGFKNEQHEPYYGLPSFSDPNLSRTARVRVNLFPVAASTHPDSHQRVASIFCYDFIPQVSGVPRLFRLVLPLRPIRGTSVLDIRERLRKLRDG